MAKSPAGLETGQIVIPFSGMKWSSTPSVKLSDPSGLNRSLCCYVSGGFFTHSTCAFGNFHLPPTPAIHGESLSSTGHYF